ncbi:MAG: MBL fold metallo-hydrolase [Methylophagaceae bacterium]
MMKLNEQVRLNRWINMGVIWVFLLLVVLPNQVRSSSVENDVQLQILGSGGPEFGDQRASSSYLIWVNGKAKILVDAGAGSGFNFEKTKAKIEDLEAILFTHLHVDHSADLPAFIKASFFSGRDRDLPVLGPVGNSLMPSTSEFVQNLLGNEGAFRYLKDYVNNSQSRSYHLQMRNMAIAPKTVQRYQLTKDILLEAIPVHHGPIPAIAWRINTFGYSITFSGDMSNNYQTLPILAKDTDILVMHNAVPESAAGVAAILHMKPSEIGEIARKAQAKQLVISHRMQRTLGQEQQTRQYIEQNYTGSILFADDLDLVKTK